MSDEKTWLDENGRHKALDLYLEQWKGWTDLLDQFADETGVTREEASQMVMIPSIRGIAQRVDRMMGAFDQMVESFNQMSEFFSILTKSYRDMVEINLKVQEQNKRNQEIQESVLGFMKRAEEESDGDAPWKDKE